MKDKSNSSIAGHSQESSILTIAAYNGFSK